MRIEQVNISEETKKMIMDGFAQHAIEKTGYDGGILPLSFAAYEGEKMAGIIDCKFFWGALHIRWLLVFPPYRNQGIGSALLLKALSYAKEQGCPFAFVETMNFQAVNFYQKMGFVIELSRPGYARNTVFHYLKKDL